MAEGWGDVGMVGQAEPFEEVLFFWHLEGLADVGLDSAIFDLVALGEEPVRLGGDEGLAELGGAGADGSEDSELGGREADEEVEGDGFGPSLSWQIKKPFGSRSEVMGSTCIGAWCKQTFSHELSEREFKSKVIFGLDQELDIFTVHGFSAH